MNHHGLFFLSYDFDESINPVNQLAVSALTTVDCFIKLIGSGAVHDSAIKMLLTGGCFDNQTYKYINMQWVNK